MKRDIFLSLPTWSVTFNGVPFDDARQGEDGIWYYRHIITHEIRKFARQDHVMVICENLDCPATNNAHRKDHGC
jgi:hypothetical protein